MSLLLAIAIWFLIRDYLIKQGEYKERGEEPAPKGILVSPPDGDSPPPKKNRNK